MNSIYLTAVDDSKNKARFYALHIVHDIWQGYSLVREYGRIGSSGTVVLTWHGDFRDAYEAMNQLVKRKLKRGYTQ